MSVTSVTALQDSELNDLERNAKCYDTDEDVTAAVSIARLLRTRFGDTVRLVREPAHWTAVLTPPEPRRYNAPFIDPRQWIPGRSGFDQVTGEEHGK